MEVFDAFEIFVAKLVAFLEHKLEFTFQVDGWLVFFLQEIWLQVLVQVIAEFLYSVDAAAKTATLSVNTLFDATKPIFEKVEQYHNACAVHIQN